MPKKTASFLDTARTFYGEAFDVHKKRDLAQSMADWSDLADDEQRFTIAHLLYLNLEAEAGSQRLLTHVCGLLNELAEAFTAAVELSLPTEDDDQDDDQDDDEPTQDPFPPALVQADVIEHDPGPVEGATG